MLIKSIFLDRDGVVNKELNYLYQIEKFEFIEGIFEACRHFQDLDYKIIIFTNQSGIFRGYYSEEQYQKLTKWMLSQFKKNKINILDIFYCPHGPKSLCNCRKPKPGMLIEAKEKYEIDMKNSWVVGDKETDIGAANSAGIKNTILVRNSYKVDASSSNAKHIVDSIKHINQVILK
jgi:D-glycero-D-manno-heptose 1,7-bisphosphate phosphatase